MKSYLCINCGLVFELNQDEELVCPRCKAAKEKLEEYEDGIIDNEIDAIIDSIIEETDYNISSNIINVNEEEKYIHISKENKAIGKIDDKCINCGQCKKTCENIANLKYNLNICKKPICTLCGQCVLNCPNNALYFKEDSKDIKTIIDANEKIVIAILSPSAKASLREALELNSNNYENKIIGCLKKLGFDYVFDGAFGNDLYVLEETAELIDKMTNKQSLPLFTSSCPTWVEYCQIYHPELLDNISKCKNPEVMHASIIKKYFCENKGFDISKLVVVSIGTCISQKDIIETKDIDYVMNMKELLQLIIDEDIRIESVEEKEYDGLVGEGCAAGQLFGVIGGMSESIVRTLYRIMTNKAIKKEDIVFNDLRNINGIKEVSILINRIKIKIAVVEEMKNLENIIRNNYYKNFHLIEVMNCKGGCVNGPGQIKADEEKLNNRKNTIYDLDKNRIVKCAHDNVEIKDLYKDYLHKPFDVDNKFLHNEVYEKLDFMLKN